jgi:hypothetical protein
MEELSVWRLTPMDLSSPLWRFSAHRSAVVVRALNEREARALVGERCGTGPIVTAHGVEIGDPWASSLISVCTKMSTESCWSTTGPAEILSFE